MVRTGLVVACAVGCAMVVLGQSPTDRVVAQTIRVQQAMNRARTLLGQNQAAEAVAALEAELAFIDGNSTYLALLRTAYATHLKELQLRNGNSTRVAELQDLLRKLDDPSSTPAAERVSPPPPKMPEPVETVSTPTPDTSDPFAQSPAEVNEIDRAPLDTALTLFEQKKYAEAEAAFLAAKNKNIPMGDSELQAWTYCRLSIVVRQLNTPGQPPLDALEAEVRAALALAPQTPGVRDFAEKAVLAEIRKRRAASPPSQATPSGWAKVETANFRIFFQGGRASADDASRAAEVFRSDTFGKWAGQVPQWSSRCDIFLHDDGASFARLTGKPAALPGLAKVTHRGAEVIARRIDLRLDDANCLTATLPHQLAYVVMSDVFSGQPVPRWAAEAIAVLSEPPARVARYHRAVPRCRDKGELMRLAAFLATADAPSPEATTPYFVESVSLVSYLVALKGERAFALFVLNGGRYGYEKSLRSQYGIQSVAELEQRWLESATAGVTQ